MRICFVSRRYWPAVSGMSVYAENLLRELVALGHEVTLVSQYRDDEAGTRVYGGGPPPPDRVPAGVEVVALASRGETVVPADWEGDIDEIVRTVVGLHADRPFDVLHAQYGYPPGLAVLRGRPAHRPAERRQHPGRRRALGRHLLHHARRGDAHRRRPVRRGAHRQRQLPRRGGRQPRQRPGALPDRPGRDRHRTASRPATGRWARCRTRRCCSSTAASTAARACSTCWRRCPQGVRLVVSGIGPDLDEAKARADGRTTFLGYVPPDEAPAVYRTADLFVSPTYSEGFSNTLLEAMASGLPTVSTNSVGVVDCLRHEENGLLHEPGDVAGLRKALERLLGDAALRADLATTALEEVRRLYSWPVLARSIDAVYDELAGTAPDPDWSMPASVDLSCRFRSAAHLL